MRQDEVGIKAEAEVLFSPGNGDGRVRIKGACTQAAMRKPLPVRGLGKLPARKQCLYTAGEG